MTPPSNDSGLIAERVTLAYSGTDVVHSASLTLAPGRVTVLIGPNGSGKSTLLRALARLHAPREGVRLGRTRLVLLLVSVVLTAAAVAAIGVIGFVGLVAPHAARALVGNRHARVLPVAALLGAFPVCVADMLGRTIIAPAQLPAGLVTAVVGAPYFLWLLWRGRTAC